MPTLSASEMGILAIDRPAITFFKEYGEKMRGLMHAANGGFGNAATGIERDMVSGGYAYGSYPEIDDLFLQQARETDRKKREALLHQIQKIAYDRVMFAPLWELI